MNDYLKHYKVKILRAVTDFHWQWKKDKQKRIYLYAMESLRDRS